MFISYNQFGVIKMINAAAIPSNQKIITVDQLKSQGYSYYKINQFVDAGILIRLNRKNYENTQFQGEDSDFYYVCAYAPEGIVCLLSAAVYYNLITYRPEGIDIAIPNKARISTVPNWPLLQFFYFGRERYGTGIQIIKDGPNQFQIYDIEKTVIDIICYRNKVGIEETKEILINYLKREDRNLNRLYRYGEKLRCSEVLRTYLEVLV